MEVLKMGLLAWMESRIKQMRWFDISLIKLSTAAAVLTIAKLWEPLLSLEWYWYGIIFVLASLRPMYMLFRK